MASPFLQFPGTARAPLPPSRAPLRLTLAGARQAHWGGGAVTRCRPPAALPGFRADRARGAPGSAGRIAAAPGCLRISGASKRVQ